MKKLLGLLAVAPLAVTACGGSADDNTIVLYADWSSDSETYNAIVEEFEKEHGMDVVIQTGSATELGTTMAGEAKLDARRADGFFTKNSMVQSYYSDLFSPLTDKHIDFDKLLTGATDEDKTFVGITYKARIMATKANSMDGGTTNIEDMTMENMFASTAATGTDAIGMRWSGDYMATNLAAYYSAIAEAGDAQRLADFKANVEKNVIRAGAIEDEVLTSPQTWNATRMLTSVVTGEIDYGITNTYYFDRVANTKAYANASNAGTDGTVATDAEWNKMNMFYPDQEGTNAMGAYVDFNSGSVLKGSQHQDKVEQLIAKLLEVENQQSLWEEFEYYPALEGTYKKDIDGEEKTLEVDSSFKIMNDVVGYDVFREHRDEAMNWIETLIVD